MTAKKIGSPQLMPGIRFLAVLTGPESRLGFPRGHDASHVLDSVAELPAWMEHRG